MMSKKLLLVALMLAILMAPIANAATLKILVPLKKGFEEFVRWKASEIPVTANSTVTFTGFAIDVFHECMKMLNYTVEYKLIGYGDGVNDPVYNELVEKLVLREADGVVADLTITGDRFRVVDFTQPYLQSSLQMIVPLQSYEKLGIRILSSPFAPDLWVAILVTFAVTILLMAWVEPFPSNDHPPLRWWQRLNQKLGKSFLYTTLAIFFDLRPDVKSRSGRGLGLAWLLVVLIFTSSYTASLSSIIISQQRRVPMLRSFPELQKSRRLIGIQEGSFTGAYLRDNLFVAPDRLVNLITQEDYYNALKSGQVSAIIDESPYMDTFLAADWGCSFKMVDSNIAYFGGFGFAFQKNSSLTNDMSLSIISLEQTGQLQRLKDKWLGSGQCALTTAPDNIFSLPFNSFGDLFFIALPVIYGFFLLCGTIIRKIIREIWGSNPHVNIRN